MKALKIYLRFCLFVKEINLGFSRGALGASTRSIDDTKPITWEFSAFSQNGEDGIVDVLISKLLISNKYFIEIGTSNGLANNTAYLALVKKFSGIMVEGSKLHSKNTRFIYKIFNKGVFSFNSFVTLENIKDLLSKSTTKTPDLFALDIDGNDFYLTKSILVQGFRPSIFVVEYNSNFGPEKSVTIPYTSNFDYSKAHVSRLYYGASIKAWIYLFSEFGYDFVTVDSNGINAFFVLKDAFSHDFLSNLVGLQFVDNKVEYQLFGLSWKDRYELISTLPLSNANEA